MPTAVVNPKTVAMVPSPAVAPVVATPDNTSDDSVPVLSEVRLIIPLADETVTPTKPSKP